MGFVNYQFDREVLCVFIDSERNKGSIGFTIVFIIFFFKFCLKECGLVCEAGYLII